MKRLLFSIIIGVLSIGTACVRQGNPNTTKSPEQLQYERAVYLIKEMGYDISDIRSAANGYIVEGDILLTQRHLDEFESRVQTRQNFNQYWLTVSKDNQKIQINSAFPYVDFSLDCLDAIQYWNEKSQCSIVLSGAGGNSIIDIITEPFKTVDGYEDFNTLMLVTPPTSDGYPGSIKINSQSSYLPKPSTEQAKYMILHAVGHAIGFTHTLRDYNDGSGQTQEEVGVPIPGTEPYDAKSIMVKESHSGWSGFSENDIKAFKAIYPTDEPEPEPEPEPDIDPSIPWIYSQDDFDIELSVRDFSEDTPYVFQNYVKQTGNFWYYHENKQKYIRITDANGRVVALGKANESYSIPYGEYTLQYGVLVESVLCGEAKVKFWQTQPRIWTNARENETIDLAREYVVKCEFDTNSPDWQEYTKSVKMVDTGTTEEVPLRFSETADRWYFRFPDRGTYKIILTVTNRLGETKTAEKTLQITSIDRTPVFYKMYEEYVGIEYGYLKNNEAVSRFSLRFYSDAACTRRIASTENTIECSYILWDDYYDIDSEPVSSTIQEQGTFLIPVGSSTCELPHDIFNGTPYTLDQHIFRYEITGFYYK